jgi:uncharacterized protein (TIGR02466 family)
VGVYDIDCSPSVNKWLIDRAYILDKFSRENADVFKKIPGGEMGVRTKYNDNHESFIGAHSWVMNRCHNFPEFPQELLRKILTCVYDYAKYIDMAFNTKSNSALYVERCWATITKPGDVIKGHNHAVHIFSSVYYPNLLPEQGNLWIDRGDPLYNDRIIYETNKGPAERIQMESKTGQFIIFPSIILHGTEPNNSKEDRISYSFDFDSIGYAYKLPPPNLVNEAWQDFNLTLANIGLTEALSE